jgi:hypothetical protein
MDRLAAVLGSSRTFSEPGCFFHFSLPSLRLPMILIVTASNDLTADLILNALAAQGHTAVFRLNLEEAHEHYALIWSAGPMGIQWSLRSLREPGLLITSDTVSAVYWRRAAVAQDGPMLALPTSANLDQQEIFWSLKWLLESLPARLFPLGHPNSHAAGDNKHRQVAAALEVGFTIPESFHSNDLTALRGFIKDQPAIALKAMRVSAVSTTGAAAEARHIACKSFQSDFLLNVIKDVSRCQLFCQEAVQRKHDLRIMVFPSETIVATIDTSQLPDNKLDWREDTLQLAHRIEPIAPAFDLQLRRFLALMNLSAGYFDFAQPASGPPVFFECNTNAEWYWIEHLTGHPISKTVAHELLCTSASQGSPV